MASPDTTPHRGPPETLDQRMLREILARLEAGVVRLREERDEWFAEVERLRESAHIAREKAADAEAVVERLREAAQNAYDEIASEWGDDDPLLMEVLDPMREALVASPDEPPDRR